MFTTDPPEELFTVDVCILEEQKDHLVFAVRVPRKTLAANHQLLAAISERICDGPNRPAFTRLPLPTLRFPRARYWLKFAALSGVLAWAINTVPSLYASDPPIYHYWATIENSEIHPGDMLVVKNLVHRKRLCVTDIDRIILTAEDMTVYADHKTGIGVAVTKTPVLHSHQFQLPTGLTPGGYKFRTVVYSNCSGTSYQMANPDIPFTVVDHPVASISAPE